MTAVDPLAHRYRAHRYTKQGGGPARSPRALAPGILYSSHPEPAGPVNHDLFAGAALGARDGSSMISNTAMAPQEWATRVEAQAEQMLALAAATNDDQMREDFLVFAERLSLHASLIAAAGDRARGHHPGDEAFWTHRVVAARRGVVEGRVLPGPDRFGRTIRAQTEQGAGLRQEAE